MKRAVLCVMCSVFATGLVSSAAANELLVETVRKAQQSDSERPRRGASMAGVRADFGDPQRRFAAVGKPPISRWQYAEFTVYFERGHVLHTVASR